MKSKIPLTKLLYIANKISPKTTIPIVIAIRLGVNRFTALSDVYPMSSRTLAKAIANLERENIIIKKKDGSYELTEKGNEFANYAEQMTKWVEKYYDISLV